MLPAYRGEQYEEFYKKIDDMSPEDQEKILREAVLFVELQKEEVEAIVCFATDANNVPFETANLAKLPAKEIHEIIVAVCLEIAKIKITLVSEDEKKN